MFILGKKTSQAEHYWKSPIIIVLHILRTSKRKNFFCSKKKGGETDLMILKLFVCSYNPVQCPFCNKGHRDNYNLKQVFKNKLKKLI